MNLGSVNPGLTSPGHLNNAYDCTGLDFIKTNPSYDTLTFGQCLEKFGEKYDMSTLTFENFMSNLQFTFPALTRKEKIEYLDKLQNFINKYMNNSGNGNNLGYGGNGNGNGNGNDLSYKGNHKGNRKGNRKGDRTGDDGDDSDDSDDNGDDSNNYKITGGVCILIVFILIILIVLYFTNF